MKKRFIISIFLSLFICMAFVSCKKDVQMQPMASLNITNAVVNVPFLKVHYFGNSFAYYLFKDSLAFGTNKVYSLGTGSQQISIVPITDTLHPLSKTVNLANGDVYSYFLAGQSTAIDTVLVKDNIPYITDSSAGVRFINLSPNSSPVNVTLSASPTVNEFSNIAYKQITIFRTYPALSTNGNYAFQVRDAATNNLLVSYTLSTPRFFNCTLVLHGLVGGSGSTALAIQRVNNY